MKSLGLDTFLSFIDFKKAFDSVDRNLLLFKLSEIGVSGKFYKAVSSMYSNPRSRIILQDYSTDYFDCPIGVKQGCCISPTLFSVFINDLAKEIKSSGIGIDLGNILGDNYKNSEYFGQDYDNLLVNVLLYADDIEVITDNENDLQ